VPREARLQCPDDIAPYPPFCDLSADCERLLDRAMTQQGLSSRAHDRILKVARTVADLERSANLDPKHIAEAIQYRTLDRSYWA
jgi:magnesium chelatase family protein